MDHPGLQRLLEDVHARRIDVIVVYKVDRLTRALSDFARMVVLTATRLRSVPELSLGWADQRARLGFPAI